MATSGYTNLDTPFTVPNTFESHEYKDIDLTKNGKPIYLGFKKNGVDDCQNNINIATRICDHCEYENTTSVIKCSNCGKPLYYITSDTPGCYGDFSNTQGGQTAGKIVFTLAENTDTKQRTVTYKYKNNPLFIVTQEAKETEQPKYNVYVNGEQIVGDNVLLALQMDANEEQYVTERDPKNLGYIQNNPDGYNIDIKYCHTSTKANMSFFVGIDSDEDITIENNENEFIIKDALSNEQCGVLTCVVLHNEIKFDLNLDKVGDSPTMDESLTTSISLPDGGFTTIRWYIWWN